ncbi:SDR family NAD(P)-dependent oxidoreductase [Paenibacillus xylanilyticus]|uniref:SDR family oxidoreductase n=1 Tax=Paenibacillus xylanilyticus TaxID=248903 RepID=A0A7Y6C0G1_9BACL|nr:SDR family oxidoreductase [Paenibacillus xylanilyticus]NUU77314.1 SDR family oxidoreductase [Paenibacillus xylanilyticus]
MKNNQHQWALITGASSGIGQAFALEMASKGNHVVLVARSESKLKQLAERIERTYKVKAEVIVSDLSEAHSPQQIYDECKNRGIQVDTLINNAGFATHGRFEQVEGARQQEEIMLNVLAVMNMTHLFLPGMLRKRNGTIINVSSTAAFQPDPYMAVYGATKSFVLSFTEALYEENRKRGVQFLALCPGATETSFFDVVNAEEASVGKRDTPEHVVEVAMKALESGKPYAVPGASNYWTAQLSRILPRRQILRVVGGMLSPRSKNDKAQRARA